MCSSLPTPIPTVHALLFSQVSISFFFPLFSASLNSFNLPVLYLSKTSVQCYICISLVAPDPSLFLAKFSFIQSISPTSDISEVAFHSVCCHFFPCFFSLKLLSPRMTWCLTELFPPGVATPASNIVTNGAVYHYVFFHWPFLRFSYFCLLWSF